MALCAPIASWWGRMEVEGLDALPRSGPVLLAGNHDSQMDPVAVELVKLRYFVGMSMPEASQVIGIPLRSAERLWSFARVWLCKTLSVAR